MENGDIIYADNVVSSIDSKPLTRIIKKYKL